MFVAGSSVAVGSKDCTMPLPCSGVSQVCCGSGCYRGDTNYDDCVWGNATPYVNNGTCNSMSSTSNGVLCCQDPPLTGS
jgi:hypothetical protein